MRRLQVGDAAKVCLSVHREIRRSSESRYYHRLHAILLVAQGMSCRTVAALFGDAPRTVENWVHSFQKQGLPGVAQERLSGRQSRLNGKLVSKLLIALSRSPRDEGLEGATVWDGKTLSYFLEDKFGVKLQVRQCQRFLKSEAAKVALQKAIKEVSVNVVAETGRVRVLDRRPH